MLRSWVQEEGGGGCCGLWLYPSDLPLLSAQMAGLLCEEEVLEVDNVKYCGYCKYHFSKMVSPACRWGRVGSGPCLRPVLGRQKDPMLQSLSSRSSVCDRE